MKNEVLISSRARVGDKCKSATRGSRADEGVRPTFGQVNVRNFEPHQEWELHKLIFPTAGLERIRELRFHERAR
jgi:hypothetical protein